MKLELDVSGIYCKVAEGGAPAAELSHKQHHWGTCFYLGLIIAKVRQYALILNTVKFLIHGITDIPYYKLKAKVLSSAQHSN